MHVDRCVIRLSGFEYGPEFTVVEIFALGVRVDQYAIQLQRGHTAFDFHRRRRWILRRNRGQTGEAIRVLADSSGEQLIRVFRELSSLLRPEYLYAWRPQRK